MEEAAGGLDLSGEGGIEGQGAHLLLFYTTDLNKGVRVGLVSKGEERIPSEHLRTAGPR